MVAFTTRMGLPLPGQITRHDDAKTIETCVVDVALPPTAYGSFVKLVAGLLQPMASGDAATVVYGVLNIPFAQSTTNTFGLSTPPVSGLVGVVRAGYVAVKLARGTAVKGAAVFVRITVSGPKLVGEIEDLADSGTCVAVVGAKFEGPADANGNCEISFNI